MVENGTFETGCIGFRVVRLGDGEHNALKSVVTSTVSSAWSGHVVPCAGTVEDKALPDVEFSILFCFPC